VGLLEAKQKLSELVERAEKRRANRDYPPRKLAAFLVPVQPERTLKESFDELAKVRKTVRSWKGLNVKKHDRGRTRLTHVSRGRMNRRSRFLLFIFCFAIFNVGSLSAQIVPGHSASYSPSQAVLSRLVETPAVSGYESEVGKIVRTGLAAFHPTTDNLGDVIVTIGSGAPNHLIVTPIDEPGFVVSEITSDGYLRVQRLPQFGLPPIFNELYAAQPVEIGTVGGKWIDGVVAGLSVHLQGAHLNPPKAGDLENFYVDIGAATSAEVRKAGVDLLSPIAINRRLMNLGGTESAGASVGDRFGAAALIRVLEQVDPAKIKGTLTIAFVVQQRTGARGLQRILTETQADEMIYVGRLLPGGPIPEMPTMRRGPRREPGSGVLIGVEKTDGALSAFGSQLKQIADAAKISFATDYSAGILPTSYLPLPAFPATWAHIGIATAWPDTPAEMIDASDFENLVRYLNRYIQDSPSSESPSKANDVAALPTAATALVHNSDALRVLVQAYGVSEQEKNVRQSVASLLPKWAKTETDDAGNLILHLGRPPAESKTPGILIVAHMDEIGFAVKSIANDGRLEVEWRGSGSLSYFAGHTALVHTAKRDLDAIIELPNGWDTHDFKWPDDEPQKADATNVIRVDVGARTPIDVAKLGISVGDTITIPKQYRPLLGTRANGRSFDDRVGDAALISAVWAIGAPIKDRDVTFVWSTGEEEGLLGAAKLAKRLAAEGHLPDFVFAVDTFVSSDSPLESTRFADAKLGEGFVIRAIDSSNIARHDLVERVIQLAHKNSIPIQYGVTAGGNDGSAFVRYGAVDIPLGWPLRYSHSPAEVVDTRDVDALARIVASLARNW
jgi:putative aminopeptidase FrvX